MNFFLSKKRMGSSVQGKSYMPVQHIPSPVIGDILLHLPLKTVVQSKIICKEWENLISGPDFAKSHFSKSPRGLFLHSEMSGNVLHFVDLTDSSLRFKLGGDTYIPQKAIVGRFLSTKIKFGKCFISSCNGFLFFCETNPSPRYYICNPITREYLKIPPLSDMSPDIETEYWRSEFGFSPKTGQYKVLRMRLSYYKQIAKIFTLGQRSWRSIEIPKDFNPYGTTAFLNGTFHWLSYRETILSFDVGAETFQEFSFPPNVDSDDVKPKFCYSLGILDECISLCRANYLEGHIEIWILKEYGVMASWVKEFVIDDVGKFASGLRVLWLMEDGEKGKNVLLVCTQSTVVSYDRSRGVCSYLKFEGLWESFTLFPHIPSLTPLKDVIVFEENSKDENEAMSPEQSMFPKARRKSDILRQHPVNPFKDENEEEMLPARRKFPKQWRMSDVFGHHPLNPFPPLPENLSNQAINQPANFLGQTSSNPSSSTKLPSGYSLALAEEKLWEKMEEREIDEHSFGKFFLDWVQEVRAMRNPGGSPASSDDY